MENKTGFGGERKEGNRKERLHFPPRPSCSCAAVQRDGVSLAVNTLWGSRHSWPLCAAVVKDGVQDRDGRRRKEGGGGGRGACISASSIRGDDDDDDEGQIYGLRAERTMACQHQRRRGRRRSPFLPPPPPSCPLLPL